MDVMQSVPEEAFYVSSVHEDVFRMTRQLSAWNMSSYWYVKATADPGGSASSMEQAGKKPLHIQQGPKIISN